VQQDATIQCCRRNYNESSWRTRKSSGGRICNRCKFHKNTKMFLENPPCFYGRHMFDCFYSGNSGTGILVYASQYAPVRTNFSYTSQFSAVYSRRTNSTGLLDATKNGVICAWVRKSTLIPPRTILSCCTVATVYRELNAYLHILGRRISPV
jgi:hypothetical protein